MARKPGARYRSDDERNRRRREETAKKKEQQARAAAPAPPPRKRGRPQAPAPELRELVDQVVGDLAGTLGGVCPSCTRPHSDEDRNCRHCGAMLRRACPSCARPAPDVDVRYCTGCGAEVPALKRAAASTEESSSSPPSRDTAAAAPPSTALAIIPEDELWEPDDVTLFAAGVDALLLKMGAPLMDDAERSRIDKRTAKMANKYFRPGGRWKDEILWVGSWAKPLLMAAYIRYVVAPDREREAKREESKPAVATTTTGESAPAPKGPVNLESVK
jgi:Double zinc ribbon